MEVSDFVRVRLRGTNERMSLYEVIRLTPQAEAQLSAQDSRETMRFAGRQWTRLAGQDEIGDGCRPTARRKGGNMSAMCRKIALR